MITSSQTTPCIRGILLPETSGQRYTHRAVCSAADQQARQEKIKNSLEQLQKWMDQANEELPEHLRDSPERLSALLQRCEVKVAYMNLYASLCLQSQEDLRLLASQAGSDDRPVGVADLLEATGGPWLLGQFNIHPPSVLHSSIHSPTHSACQCFPLLPAVPHTLLTSPHEASFAGSCSTHFPCQRQRLQLYLAVLFQAAAVDIQACLPHYNTASSYASWLDKYKFNLLQVCQASLLLKRCCQPWKRCMVSFWSS